MPVASVAAVMPANHFRRDLLNAGIGSGAHGFAFDLTVLPTPPAGATITLRADNLLDEQFRDAASRVKSFTFNPGRNISVVYRIGF